MKALKWIGIPILIIIGIPIALMAWVFVYQNFFGTDEIRYRLTVTVDDNGKVVEGSGVLASYWTTLLPFGLREPITGVRCVSSYAGEAVVVDLGTKGQIYAVLTEENKFRLPIAYGVSEGAIDCDQLPQIRAMRGTRDLDRRSRPKLMTFGDRLKAETTKGQSSIRPKKRRSDEGRAFMDFAADRVDESYEVVTTPDRTTYRRRTMAEFDAELQTWLSEVGAASA